MSLCPSTTQVGDSKRMHFFNENCLNKPYYRTKINLTTGPKYTLLPAKIYLTKSLVQDIRRGGEQEQEAVRL